MSIDTRTPGSPGWWLAALGKELKAKRKRLDSLNDYAVGNHPLPEGTNATTREAYTAFQAKARTNLPGLIVEAVKELLIPVGLRTGHKAWDDAAWRIWQANSLDADCGLVHGSAVSMSEGYVIVGDVDDETGEPLITVEDPRQVVTSADPVRPRRVRAAMKMYEDAVKDQVVAYLYLNPDDEADDKRVRVYKAVADKPNIVVHNDVPEFEAESFDWVWDEPEVLKTTLNPVVRFRNRPQIDGSCLGEFEDVTDMIDRINHMVLDRLVIATMQAFRQRALKGDLPKTDADGNPIDWNTLFAPGPDALWNLPDGVDLWESVPTDITPLLAAVKDDVRNLGAVTRTPPHYMLGDYTNASAEAAQLARMGLENKALDRMKELGESWETVFAVAFYMKGMPEAARNLDNELIWQPPQRLSLNERAFAIAQVGDKVPWPTLMRDVWQVSPAELARMEKERKAETKAADKRTVEQAEALRPPEPPAPAAPNPDEQPDAA